MAGVSSRELSGLVGLSHSALWQLESGVISDTRTSVARSIAEVLGVTLDWLLAGEGDEPEATVVQEAIVRARAKGAA